MKKFVFAVILIQLREALAEVVFRHLTSDQSLQLACALPRDHVRPSSLHLYHRGAGSQNTLLSMAEGGERLRVGAENEWRLRVRGGLDSPQVNVTVSHLRHSDSGLYTWELRYREEDGPDLVLTDHRVFLLVQGAGRLCHCSSPYPPLLWTIFAAAGLLVLTLCCLATEKCLKKPRRRHGPTPPAPIYEEMSRKQQQSAAIARNNHETAARLEEDHLPVYANPRPRQQQDNYYACPRELALRA